MITTCAALAGLSGNITVQFADGIYVVPAGGEQFTSLDQGISSSKQIIYTSANAGKAVISGGTVLTPGHWKTDPTYTGAFEYAFTSNPIQFEQMWVGGTAGTGGTRRFRIRPHVDATTGAGQPYLYNAGPVKLDTAAHADAACNHAYIAVFPPPSAGNCTPVASAYQCLDRFYIKSSDYQASGNIDPNWTAWQDSTNPIEIINFENWTTARMHLKEIDNQSSYVGLINTPNSTAKIAVLTAPETANTSSFGFIPGHRFLLENVKDAMSDSRVNQGAWYLDQSVTPWVLHYMPTAGEASSWGNQSLNNPQVIIPQQPVVMNETPTISGGTNYGFHWVKFLGLTISHGNWYAADPGTGNLGWATTSLSQNSNGQGGYVNDGSTDGGTANTTPANVNASVVFNSASHLSLFNNIFTQNAGYALDVIGNNPQDNGSQSGCSATAPGSCNIQITGNTFSDLGSGAMRIGLFPDQNGTDTSTSIPANNLIYQNTIYGGDRQVTGAVLFVGNSHDNFIDSNTLTDFYTYGIALGHSLNYNGCGSGSGCTNFMTNNTLTNNLIYDLGKGITSDIGAFHVAVGLSTGNIIQYNHIHNIVQAPNCYASSTTLCPTPNSVGVSNPWGYGGWGIYLDQGSAFINVSDNVVYNTSWEAFEYNSSRAVDTNGCGTDMGTYSVPTGATPNQINNNIFAFNSFATLSKATNDDSHAAMSSFPTGYGIDANFNTNIFYWDNTVPPTTGGLTTPSPLAGGFYCFYGSFDNCYTFSDNLYFASSATGTSAGTNNATCSTAGFWCWYTGPIGGVFTLYGGNQWRSVLNEDLVTSNSTFNTAPTWNVTSGCNTHSPQPNCDFTVTTGPSGFTNIWSTVQNAGSGVTSFTLPPEGFPVQDWTTITSFPF